MGMDGYDDWKMATPPEYENDDQEPEYVIGDEDFHEYDSCRTSARAYELECAEDDDYALDDDIAF